MKKNVFIKTKNVNNFRKAMSFLQTREQAQPGFCVVQGDSGRGKSYTALNWQAQNRDAVYIRTWEGWSQHDFLRRMALDITGDMPHGCSRCKQAIMERLERRPQTVIIIDEADRLAVSRLEDLRDLVDCSTCSVVLIGEDGFYSKLRARRRIYSRVAQLVEFSPVSVEDIQLYLLEIAGLTTDEAAADKIIQFTDGSFREVYNLAYRLEEAAKAQKNVLVTVETLKQLGVCK